jgi:hypothetical protein
MRETTPKRINKVLFIFVLRYLEYVVCGGGLWPLIGKSGVTPGTGAGSSIAFASTSIALTPVSIKERD